MQLLFPAAQAGVVLKENAQAAELVAQVTSLLGVAAREAVAEVAEALKQELEAIPIELTNPLLGGGVGAVTEHLEVR